MSAGPWLVSWLVLASLGCGGGQTATGPAGSTTQAPPSASACIPVVPMQLLVLEHGREWEPMAIVQADGWVYSGKSNGPVARIATDRVTNPRGETIFTCANDQLGLAGQPQTMRFEPNGDLVDARVRIHVEPTGEVFMTMGGAPKSMGRVQGPQQSPRTAAVLVMMALAGANWNFH